MSSLFKISVHIGLLCFLLGYALFSSSVAFGAGEQEFHPLTGIPGVDPENANLVDYVNALFLLSIALGAMLAVVKIALAGFMYMMSDVVTKKDAAREQIQGALIGLGILLATFVVLYAINPNLTNLNVLSGAESIALPNNPQNQDEEETTPVECPDGSTYVKDTTGEYCRPTGGFTYTFGAVTQDTFFQDFLAEYNLTASEVRGQFTSPDDNDDSYPWGQVASELNTQCSGSVINMQDLPQVRHYCIIQN